MKPRRKLGLLAATLVCLITLSGIGQATTVDFDSVDASGGPVNASSYLAGYGITFTPITPGWVAVIYDDRNETYTNAPSPHNWITFQGTANYGAYTLNFAVPVDNFSFDWVAVNTPSIFPWWQATAYDTGGNPLSTVGEDLWSGTRSAQTFNLNGQDIKYVIFESDANAVAGFAGPLLDNFSFAPVPIPGSLLLLGSGLLGLAGVGRRLRKS